MRFVALTLTLFLTSLLCFAAEGQPVSYQSGGETVKGMLYAPSAKGPLPALVVIHEWWGLNDWVKQQASKLSDEGYITLAVDLYRGKVANTPEEAHELSRGLPPDRASRDLKAAFDYLKSRKDVDAKRIGSIGWCMGGGYSFDMALIEPTLAASVINYGHISTDPGELKQIHASILGIFGAQDRGIPVQDVRKFESELREQGKNVRIVVYPDAGHAFENPNNKPGYRAQDAADAWNKTVSFLDANLKKVGARSMRRDEDDDDDVRVGSSRTILLKIGLQDHRHVPDNRRHLLLRFSE